MPIKKGTGKEKISSNIKELIHTYKETGKIGNTTPKDMKHARKIASAIAYDKAGKKKSTKVEALEDFILSLAYGTNKTLIENVIMEAFDVCFNSILIEDALQKVQTTTTSPTSSDPNAPSSVVTTVDPEKLTADQARLAGAQLIKVADEKKKAEAQNLVAATEEQKLQALATPPK